MFSIMWRSLFGFNVMLEYISNWTIVFSFNARRGKRKNLNSFDTNICYHGGSFLSYKHKLVPLHFIV